MIYKVTYNSMTANYGPAFIEAESEQEACSKFGRGAFNGSERSLISARPVSENEIRRALKRDHETD